MEAAVLTATLSDPEINDMMVRREGVVTVLGMYRRTGKSKAKRRKVGDNLTA